LKLFRSLAFVSFALATSIAAAQTARIGFVNTERIFREATPARAAQTKLEQEFARRERDLTEQGNRVRQLTERFERDSPTLSEADKQRRQRELVDQDRDFQRKRREFQEDLNARKNEELQAVLERANRVVRQIAEQERFDVILQEAVYVNPALDITDRVLRVLNGGTAAPR
jgi:outer membrane protein